MTDTLFKAPAEKLTLSVAARALLLLSIFFLPFELPITQAAHGILRDYIGWLYLLVHPFTAALFLSLVVRNGAPSRLLMGCVIAIAVGIGASTVIQDGNAEMALRYVYFACGSLLLGHFIGRQEDDAYLLALIYGAVAWSVMVLVAYAAYYSSVEIAGFHEMSIGDQIAVLRSPGADIANGSIFFLLAGNVNKVANYAVLFMLAGALAYLRGSITFRLLLVFQALMVAILTICFSRGAFMVCVLIAVGFAIGALWYRWRKESCSRSLAWLAVLLAVPPMISVAHPDLRSRWTDMRTVEYRVEQMAGISDAAGTATPKEAGEPVIVQPVKPAKVQRPPESGQRLLILGYGTGNYGLKHYGDPARRTHNLFLDLWTDGGLVSPIALVVLMGLTAIAAGRIALRTWSPEAFVGLAGLLTIVVLAFREYELAYLNATAMGGFLLGLLMGIARSQIPGTKILSSSPIPFQSR